VSLGTVLVYGDCSRNANLGARWLTITQITHDRLLFIFVQGTERAERSAPVTPNALAGVEGNTTFIKGFKCIHGAGTRAFRLGTPPANHWILLATKLITKHP